ncbi:MAG TPA: thioredoxin domain-containing protein [Vicinamibacteria bacterium]|nr:thioredoxin domain-containing protein [Vicinamibacteria bacterium]
MRSTAGMRVVAALCLCLGGAAVSSWLLAQHHGEPRAVSAVNQACGDGRTSGCEDVARSSWSSVAGRPVAAYGLGFYLSLGLLLGLALVSSPDLRETLAGIAVAGLALGLLVDLLLLGVQAFAIHAYCRLCILTYLLSAGALLALLPEWRAARATGVAARNAEGRLAFAGWVLGSLAVAGAVLAADVALGARAARRQATLLGTVKPAAEPGPRPAGPPVVVSPPMPASGSSPEAPVRPGDAKYWRERAEKLQATLDDARKLEAYFSEKAQREFEAAAPVSIDLANTPARGQANAPVRVVEFSDFMCPFCRNLAGALTQFVPQAGGRVVVYFKNFPLDNTCNPKLPRATHPGSCNLAMGAICANYQGKFEAYHDRVFQAEVNNPQPADVVRLAGEAGLNSAAVEGCLGDPKTKADLAAQVAEGNRLEINATPTLYINGKKLPRLNDFVPVVDKEARKKGFPPLGQ